MASYLLLSFQESDVVLVPADLKQGLRVPLKYRLFVKKPSEPRNGIHLREVSISGNSTVNILQLRIIAQAWGAQSIAVSSPYAYASSLDNINFETKPVCLSIICLGKSSIFL